MQPSGRRWVLVGIVGMVGRFCRCWADVGPTPFSALTFPAISVIDAILEIVLLGLAVFVNISYCIRGYASHQSLSIV